MWTFPKSGEENWGGGQRVHLFDHPTAQVESWGKVVGKVQSQIFWWTMFITWIWKGGKQWEAWDCQRSIFCPTERPSLWFLKICFCQKKQSETDSVLMLPIYNPSYYQLWSETYKLCFSTVFRDAPLRRGVLWLPALWPQWGSPGGQGLLAQKHLGSVSAQRHAPKPAADCCWRLSCSSAAFFSSFPLSSVDHLEYKKLMIKELKSCQRSGLYFFTVYLQWNFFLGSHAHQSARTKCHFPGANMGFNAIKFICQEPTAVLTFVCCF